MSVSLYTNSELSSLWHRLGATPELDEIIRALGYANRAAHLMMYGTLDDVDPIVELSEDRVATNYQPFITPYAWASNLVYNCITNGGRSFAHGPDRDALLRIASHITDTEQAARGVKS